MTAAEFFDARERHSAIEKLPSANGLDLDAAYALDAEVRKMREAAGHTVVGRKVGYANKALWRILRLDTLVWDSMYEDTVHMASQGSCEFAVGAYRSPRIEPEIVIKIADPQSGDGLLAAEWVAFGFEILDNPYPDWKFQPVDFVAAGGLHSALIVGPPMTVTSENRETLAAQLADFKLVLLRGDEVIEEGAGRNSLRSPALCVAELAKAAALRGDAIRPGELISTGTLTNAPDVAPGQQWRVELSGLPLETVRLQLT